MHTKPSSHFLTPALVVALGALAICSEPPQDLQEIQNLALPELRSANSVVISRDGKFAYAAAFNSASVTTFKRDPATGQLELDDVVTNPGLRAVASLSFSRDEKYAAACAFASNTLTLFKRDAGTGRLSVLDSVSEGVDGMKGLNWVIASNFSPKGDYLYTGSADGVGVFELKDDKLNQIQHADADGRLKGIRAVTLSPNGEWIYVPATNSGTVGVFRRDPNSGCVSVSQILSNSESGTKCLDGVFRAAVSSDGKFVYLGSGRFRGDQAVSAFAVGDDGRLTMLQEFVDGTGPFTDFKGGNSLALSPDEKHLFALASVSDRLFRFKRDPATGNLSFLGSQAVGKFATPGSAGLCFSPDGKFVYVADEASSSIVGYQIPK